jgi:hypothetical protein
MSFLICGAIGTRYEPDSHFADYQMTIWNSDGEEEKKPLFTPKQVKQCERLESKSKDAIPDFHGLVRSLHARRAQVKDRDFTVSNNNRRLAHRHSIEFLPASR